MGESILDCNMQYPPLFFNLIPQNFNELLYGVFILQNHLVEKEDFLKLDDIVYFEQ